MDSIKNGTCQGIEIGSCKWQAHSGGSNQNLQESSLIKRPAGKHIRSTFTLWSVGGRVSKSGSYHYSGYPDVSWAEFATEIFNQAKRAVVVTPISTVDYPTRATRPMNSRIDCGTTEQMFDVIRPDWREGLKTILKELEVI